MIVPASISRKGDDMEQPKIIHISEHVDAAVTFIASWEVVDPQAKYRNHEPQPQRVTTCILRVVGKGPKETFTGTAICSPRDYESTRTGQVVALSRALADLTGKDRKTCRSWARRWFWEQDCAAKVAASVAVEAQNV